MAARQTQCVKRLEPRRLIDGYQSLNANEGWANGTGLFRHRDPGLRRRVGSLHAGRDGSDPLCHREADAARLPRAQRLMSQQRLRFPDPGRAQCRADRRRAHRRQRESEQAASRRAQPVRRPESLSMADHVRRRRADDPRRSAAGSRKPARAQARLGAALSRARAGSRARSR